MADPQDFEHDLNAPLEGIREADAANEGPGGGEGEASGAGTARPGGPAVGKDEWVARHAERRTLRSGSLGVYEQRLRAIPWWAWLTLFVAIICALPIAFESGYVRRVAFDTVVYMLLALGLNVVVGWGGLLDLGYVAFFGIGAYAYAMVSSDKFDVHLPTLVSVPLITLLGAGIGLLVALPSRRLVGDYLAIVTLFFLQMFNTFLLNGDRIRGNDITGGPNGIVNVDPISIFGWEIPVSTDGIFNVTYLYIATAVFALVYVGLRCVNESRTGRAWRSLREDSLAAEMMGMPVNWLKLMAFSFGAAVAALTGTLTAAVNASVFAQNYDFALLITIYTMVILGGAGSQAGVVIGAVLISVLLEALREPSDSRTIFYTIVVLSLVAVLRFSWRLVVVVAGTVVLGVVVRLAAERIDEDWTAGVGNGGGRLAEWASDWVIVPDHLAQWVGTVSYIALIVAILVLTVVRGWLRIALLIPTLYLAAFVWENVLLARPEPTRYIVLGAILVALMIARPSGLLGEKRVEIV